MQLVAPLGGSHSGAWLSTLSTGTRRGALEVTPLPTPGPLEERRAVQGPTPGGRPSPRAGVPGLLQALPPVCLPEQEQRRRRGRRRPVATSMLLSRASRA